MSSSTGHSPPSESHVFVLHIHHVPVQLLPNCSSLPLLSPTLRVHIPSTIPIVAQDLPLRRQHAHVQQDSLHRPSSSSPHPSSALLPSAWKSTWRRRDAARGEPKCPRHNSSKVALTSISKRVLRSMSRTFTSLLAFLMLYSTSTRGTCLSSNVKYCS